VPPSPQKATILVVEDDEELRNLYRHELMMVGYAVAVAADGVAALQWIDTHRPDVIVLDWALPRLGGRDVQREVASHAETRDIPIILVTGVAADREIDPADFCEVLRKPIDVEEMVRAVMKCVPPTPRSWSFR
jgi:CheY-like chemotaxis protein